MKYQACEQGVNNAVGDVDVDVQKMVKTGCIEGRVTDAKGKGLAVHLGWGGEPPKRFEASTLSD